MIQHRTPNVGVASLQGGMYVLNLYNWQSGGVSLVFLALFEAVTVSWGYGADRFAANVQDMTGNKLWRWWTFCWKFCTPLVTLGKRYSFFHKIFISCLTSCTPQF